MSASVRHGDASRTNEHRTTSTSSHSNRPMQTIKDGRLHPSEVLATPLTHVYYSSLSQPVWNTGLASTTLRIIIWHHQLHYNSYSRKTSAIPRTMERDRSLECLQTNPISPSHLPLSRLLRQCECAHQTTQTQRHDSEAHKLDMSTTNYKYESRRLPIYNGTNRNQNVIQY